MSTQNNISFYENITKNKEIIDMEIFMAKLLNINILFITDKHYLNQNFNKNKNKDEISKITNHFETKFYSPNEKEHYKFKTIILYELKNYNFNYNNFLRKKHFIYYILDHYNDIVKYNLLVNLQYLYLELKYIKYGFNNTFINNNDYTIVVKKLLLNSSYFYKYFNLINKKNKDIFKEFDNFFNVKKKSIVEFIEDLINNIIINNYIYHEENSIKNHFLGSEVFDSRYINTPALVSKYYQNYNNYASYLFSMYYICEDGHINISKNINKRMDFWKMECKCGKYLNHLNHINHPKILLYYDKYNKTEKIKFTIKYYIKYEEIVVLDIKYKLCGIISYELEEYDLYMINNDNWYYFKSNNNCIIVDINEPNQYKENLIFLYELQ